MRKYRPVEEGWSPGSDPPLVADLVVNGGLEMCRCIRGSTPTTAGSVSFPSTGRQNSPQSSEDALGATNMSVGGCECDKDVRQPLRANAEEIHDTRVGDLLQGPPTHDGEVGERVGSRLA